MTQCVAAPSKTQDRVQGEHHIDTLLPGMAKGGRTILAATLRIQLLGEFRIQHDEQPLAEFNSPRLQSLLAYLILHRSVIHTRQHLAFLFWPDSSDSQARTNLRNALHQLRNTLPNIELYLQIEPQTIAWRADAPYQADVAHFEDLIKQVDSTQPPALQRQLLEQALALYKGELLPDFYEEWILQEREEWRQKYVGGLEMLVNILEQQRDYRTAIDMCQRLLKFDPLLESSYTQLMRLHALNGDRAAALRVYHSCMTTLVRELGVEPGPTTQSVYEQLLKLEATPPSPSAAPTASVTSLLPFETSLVGRDAVWQQMQTIWQETAGGHPTLLTISAEAGLGKTRLATELMEWASRQGIHTATAHCYAAGGRLAFAPIVAWLRSPVLTQARPSIEPHGFAEAARLLPELLQEHPDLPTPLPVAPQTEAWHRQQLFEALARLALPAPHPLLLVLDDAHWCDADTLEWVQYLFHTNPQAPLLLLATVRPEETPVDHPMSELQRQLARVGRLKQLELTPLTSTETAQLVGQLAGHIAENGLDAHFDRQIFAETEGNPLFILETVRSTLDAGQTQVKSNHHSDTLSATLPPKIRAIMETRLMRLSPAARDLVAIAALIGRAFTLDVLTHVAEMDEDELLLALDELWQQRIVREATAGETAGGAYDFSHDKLREVARATLSPMMRRMLHRRLASALEELFAANLDEAAAQIGLHYEHAGQPTAAIGFYQRAARFDHRRSAQHEAIFHLRRTLALLEKLPASATRDAQELKIQLALGALLLSTHGYADPVVETAFSRAWALCRHSDDPATKFQTLWGLERYYLVKPELEKGQAITQELLLLAHQAEDAGLILEATYALGTYLFHYGSLGEAQRYLEQTLALFDRAQHGDHALHYAQDPQVVALTYLALALWCQGRLDQARARSQEAIAIARQIEHPYSLVVALTYAGVLHQFADEPAACAERATQAQALAQAHGFSLWISMSGFLQGWALAQQGDAQRGLGLMMQCAEGFRQTGAELGSAYSTAMLAQCLSRFGQPDQARMIMQQSLALLAKTQERLCAAEIHRIQGELLATEPQTQEKAELARAHFENALTIAQEQNAKWWELRAALSLAHLTQQREGMSAALQQLETVVEWFTEGEEQTIVKQAKATLL